MSKWTRLVLIVFSLLVAVGFAIVLLMLLSAEILNGVLLLMLNYIQRPTRWIGILVTLFGFIIAVASLVIAILSGRLRKARVRSNEIGVIDIGVDAIESIALNSAKASQSGIKAAKARVAPVKGRRLFIRLNVLAYSDVELPVMMAKVQERVKKDIERYTGLEVDGVEIKVGRVEAIAARVER